MDDDSIRDYLVQNPDFFQRNPELLDLLQIPHDSGSAVSLVEHQVSVLRERNVDLRHRLRDLGSLARDNDQLFADTRALVLSLLEAEDVESCSAALRAVMKDHFDVEYANLILFTEVFGAEGPAQRVAESQARGMLAGLLGREQAGCGTLRAEEFEFLFPGARLVGSAGVAIIQNEGPALGLFAVGSSDASHYRSDMGTLFLEFAAEVLGKRLRSYGGVS